MLNIIRPNQKGTMVMMKKRMKPSQIRLLAMTLPFVLFIFLFSYVPLFGWVTAFFDYHPGVPLSKVPFVGLKYFKMALNFKAGSNLGVALRNTFVYSFIGLATSPLPVIYAICLNEMSNKYFKKTIQTITTLPNFISWILVYAISFATFSIDDGFVNQLLTKMGFQPISPMTTNSVTYLFQTLWGTWKGLGFNAIIYLAAIGSIDVELFDAAEIDGAGRLQKILHVTVPQMAPTYIVLLLLSVSNILSAGFDQQIAFWNNAVANRLEVFDTYIYHMGIGSNMYSYGTAMGIFKTIVSVTLLFGVNWLSKKFRGDPII